MLLLLPGSAIELGPQDLKALLLPKPHAHLPNINLIYTSKVSVIDFSPVHFRG